MFPNKYFARRWICGYSSFLKIKNFKILQENLGTLQTSVPRQLIYKTWNLKNQKSTRFELLDEISGREDVVHRNVLQLFCSSLGKGQGCLFVLKIPE